MKRWEDQAEGSGSAQPVTGRIEKEIDSCLTMCFQIHMQMPLVSGISEFSASLGGRLQ